MKVLLDLNVLLDVVQNRVPHYHDSAKVLSLAQAGQCDHVVTWNVSDFVGSPVPALTPADFLRRRS